MATSNSTPIYTTLTDVTQRRGDCWHQREHRPRTPDPQSMPRHCCGKTGPAGAYRWVLFLWPRRERTPAEMDEPAPRRHARRLAAHPLTIARRLAGGALTPEYWRLISSGRVAGQSHDELRLFLIKDNGPTVNLTISLTGRPKAFSFAVRGTDGVLAIDLRNMLFSINIDSGGPIARHSRLIRASLGVLCQIVANTCGPSHRSPRALRQFVALDPRPLRGARNGAGDSGAAVARR